jgi:lipopolysaccharide/colanic/teichoic acid biosynthesis glycosyltransferase
MEYVNRASVWLDLWIVLKTLPCLLGDREKSR